MHACLGEHDELLVGILHDGSAAVEKAVPTFDGVQFHVVYAIAFSLFQHSTQGRPEALPATAAKVIIANFIFKEER